MIDLWHKHEIAVVDGNRFVKAVVGVHTLEGETVAWLNMMVVGFFQVSFMRRILGIVFMGWKRGPVACRSDDLDKDQTLGLLIHVHNVLDTTPCIALAPQFYAHILWSNHARRQVLVCGWGTGNGDLHAIRGTFDAVVGIFR